MGSLAGADLLTNQRTAPRVVYHRKGQLVTGPHQNVVPIKTIDISTIGVGALVPFPLPERQTCTLRITALDQDNAQELILKGAIAYCILSGIQGFRIGIQFAELDPVTRSRIERIISGGYFK